MRDSVEPDESELFKNRAYDAVLGLIENRIGGQRLRGAVAQVLKLEPGADLATHEAILQLATSKRGSPRLVTTNFDKGFELAPYNQARTIDYAPFLPTPDSEWGTIVHLHGGLGDPRNADGRRLVLTSADFGRAYVTEGWAGKFLTELFRRSSAILFIGYSVSDPAIRYVVDAFAAERANGRGQPAQAFIFVAAADQQGISPQRTWRARGVEPLPYDERENHRLLHETLRNCASNFRFGYLDRTNILREHGRQEPHLALESESASQVLWALKEESGGAARKFAKLDPSPPVQWLELLSKHELLGQPGTPFPVPAVSWMPAATGIPTLHPVTEGLCRWLATKLAEPQLLHWVIKQGSHLHHGFAALVRERLTGGTTDVPPPGLARIWRFLSLPSPPLFSGRFPYGDWPRLDAIEDSPWESVLRELVRTWLAPTIRLQCSPWPRAADVSDACSSYAHAELVPAVGERVWDVATKLFQRPDADRIAEDLLGDLTDMLRRGLSYLEYFEQIDSTDDFSYISRPSIDDHTQNSDLDGWTAYVQMLRDTWQRVSDQNPALARAEVTRWMNCRYPLFRRFVLWSAAKPGGLPEAELVEYLSAQPSTTIWGSDTRRELFQCLQRLALSQTPSLLQRLCELILVGPPREEYRADLEENEFQNVADRGIVLRLLKLRDSGARLPVEAQQALNEIFLRHPGWPKEITEQDEFESWCEVREGGPDFQEQHLYDYLEWTDQQVLVELRSAPQDASTLKRWRGLLERNPRRAVRLLEQLGLYEATNKGIWEVALGYLDQDEMRADCVRLFAAFGNKPGLEVIREELRRLTSIVERYVREPAGPEDPALWQLWDLLIGPAEGAVAMPQGGASRSALSSAIGELAEALLIGLTQTKPATFEEIPESLRDRLGRLLNGAQPAHADARAVLARATAWLHQLKPGLVVPEFLNRFDWAQSPEAPDIWRGFLKWPALTPELWPEFRPLLLKAVAYSEGLGRNEEYFYALLADILLKPQYPLADEEARNAIKQAGPRGREHLTRCWWLLADPSPERGAALYRKRLKHLLTSVWPIDLDIRDEESSVNLALLAMACGTEFEDAVRTITPLLKPASDLGHLMYRLKDSEHLSRRPEATLSLLKTIIGDKIPPGLGHSLGEVIDQLLHNKPELEHDPDFLRLDALRR